MQAPPICSLPPSLLLPLLTRPDPRTQLPNLHHCQPDLLHQPCPDNNSIMVWVHFGMQGDVEGTLRSVGKYMRQNEAEVAGLRDMLSEYLLERGEAEGVWELREWLGAGVFNQVLRGLLTRLAGTDKLGPLLAQFETTMMLPLIDQYLQYPSNLLLSTFKSVFQLSAGPSPQLIPLFTRSLLPKYFQHPQPTPKPHTFLHLKLLQLLHIADPCFPIQQLATHHTFVHGALYQGFCDFETKGANPLCINIYGSILKQLGCYSQSYQLFVDIYTVLDSYGMHLIRDIWDRFYILTRAHSPPVPNNYHLYPITTLLHIILSKVQQHPNSNVPKYCIQSLLSAPVASTAPIFQSLPQTVYQSLLQILNSGTHYHDISHFHQDSKIYQLTQEFYLSYYRQLPSQQLIPHLRKLVTAMGKYITFQHCVMAYGGILAGLPQSAGRWMGHADVEVLLGLLGRFLGRLTFRKRYRLMEWVLGCMSACVEFRAMGLQRFVGEVVMRLHQSAFVLKGRDGAGLVFKLITENYTQGELLDYHGKLHKQVTTLALSLCSASDPEPGTLATLHALQSQLILLQSCTPHNPYLSALLSQNKLSLLVQSLYTPQLQYTEVIRAVQKLVIYQGLQRVSDRLQGVVEGLLGVVSRCVGNVQVSGEQLRVALEVVAYALRESTVESKCYAKLLQYCIEQITIVQNSNRLHFLDLLLNALSLKLLHTTKYKAIESCLYTLLPALPSLALPVNQHLRLQTLTLTILAHDSSWFVQMLQQKPEHWRDVQQVGNLYDIGYYEELFWYYGAVAGVMSKKKGEQWEEFKGVMGAAMREAARAMLDNIEYGVHRKEVIAVVECFVKVGLCFDLDDASLQSLQYLLNVGEKYWGFHRHTVLTFLSLLPCRPLPPLLPNLPPLFFSLACIEEYRGSDSAMLLPQHQKLPVYTHKLLHPEADYDGCAVRFAVIDWMARKLNAFTVDAPEGQREMFMGVFWECFQYCCVENVNERLFITGSHKTKLKLWQFLMVYPKFIAQHCSEQQFTRIIEACLDILPHSNLQQTKHYSQTFLLQLLSLRPCARTLALVSTRLSQNLLLIFGQSSILRHVGTMMLAGLVLELHFDHRLYSILFTSVCSHIAYYRGISQYFCYRMIGKAREAAMGGLEYIEVLYGQYGRDHDARRLSEKLEGIVEGYKKLVREYDVYAEILGRKVSINGQVVSDNHYIDKIKHLGYELVKEVKHEDGFMPSKQIWRKIVSSHLPPLPSSIPASSQPTTFQRKIDPSLDDLYSYQPLPQHRQRINHLKVLVISAETVALYGHMARVGEILGIEELCIPTLSILDMEEFSNVSVTAEKWLRISEHGCQRVLREVQKKAKAKGKKNKTDVKQQQYETVGKQGLNSVLQGLLSEGYNLYLVKKQSNNIITDPSSLTIPRKCVIIIDQLQLYSSQLECIVSSHISFNPYYSHHVEGTIFIWEYFKQYTLAKDQ